MIGECIVSPLSKDKDGYPRLKHQGKLISASRLLWKILFGDIPKGKQINHTCDNPSCVNPDHLYLGTFRENMDDKIIRKRVAGNNHPRVKIPDDIVVEICNKYSSGNYTQQDLSDEYGVSQSVISAYTTGKRRTLLGDNR